MERLETHIKNCPSNNLIPEESQQQFPFLTGNSAESSKIQRKSTQTSIPTLFQNVSSFKEAADLQFTRFVIACNLPFSVVDHPQFIKYSQLLRQSYKPAHSGTVSGHLLDNIYMQERSKGIIAAKAKFATIMQDGWSDNSQSPVISHCINVEGRQSFFLNAIPTSNISKTSANCCTMAIDAIKVAEEEFQCKIGAFVTDNCNTMLLMRTMIVTERPDIWAYGCNTHLMNLVGKDTAPEDLLESVKKVQHFFKDKQYPRETLRKIGGLAVVLPKAIRWNSWKT